MARILQVAVAQVEPLPVDAPVEEFAVLVEQARFAGADLVVFPELHLFGDLRGQRRRAEPLDGPRIRGLSEVAARAGVWLVPGSVAERGADGELYNTAVVFAPDGSLVASYRKCFPWRPYEPHRPGSTFTVFDIPGIGRLGLSICYDTWFPEVARQLAWLGAEVIITPTRTTTVDRAQELVLTRAHAIVNQVFVVSANVAAPTGTGQSMIVDPEGRVRVSAGRPAEVLTDVLDLDEVRKVREHGTAGLNRMWYQFTAADRPLELPVYQGKIDPTTWKGDTER